MTKIEWTEQTWNPTTGCTKISSGCKYCYAETMANRLQAMGVMGYQNGFDLSLLPDRLAQPLQRKKPTLYFVNSMSDLFHEGIPDLFIEDVFKVITQATQHEFQILTKRAARMAAFFQTRQVPKNAWLGVTVEDQKQGLPRIEHLRHIDVGIRFLSIEPLLENLGAIDLREIHWVIVGGESGAKARQMQEEWALDIQRQCQNNNVPFFFKQLGAWGRDGGRRDKKKNGRQLSGKLFDGMPLFNLNSKY